MHCPKSPAGASTPAGASRYGRRHHVVSPCSHNEQIRETVPGLRIVRGIVSRIGETWCLLAFLSVLVTGCDGCRPGSAPPAEQAANSAPQDDYTTGPPRPLPSDARGAQDALKPGHWFTASQSLRSNQIDARGELRTEAVGAVHRGAADGVRLQSIVCERGVVLPKGQMRRFDVRTLCPRFTTSLGTNLQLRSRFVTGGGGAYVDTMPQLCATMAPEEYFIAVLTHAPERFTRLQTGDWARPFRDPHSGKPTTINYRFVFPDVNSLLTIPSTVLDWTSIAVVIWDDVTIDALTPDQRQAFEDWLQFGGRLVINGSDAAACMASSSFAELLPIASTGNIELEADLASRLLTQWSVVGDDSTEKQIARLRNVTHRIAVGGDLRDGADGVVNTEGLVASRRLGRGVIVQSRFDLTSDWLSNWKSYDSFFNAVILNRPARRFRETETRINSMVASVYDPDVAGNDDSLRLIAEEFVDANVESSHLPAINTGLRFASRDAVLPVSVLAPSALVPIDTEAEIRPAIGSDPIETSPDDTSVGAEPALTRIDVASGVSGWTDDSDVMRRMREILKSESGIVIPKSSLVVRSLSWYLLILVPVNYLVFRLLGRLEYAWLAAPVIAIFGAAWVARSAQLDIGFARSHTELALLELPADYSRGHLTRTIAVYNSLSTRYDIQFSTADAAAAPLDILRDQSAATDVVLQTAIGDGPRLAGFAVGSNQVRLLHTEQILDVGGPIQVVGDNLVNLTSLELADVFVVERMDDHSLRLATVATCSAGGQVRLRFRNLDEVTVSDDLPMQTKLLISDLASGRSLEIGASRIVARVDAALPGMEINPQANQRNIQTIVLAHLNYAALREIQPDENLASTLLDRRPDHLQAPDEPLILDE